MTITPSSTRKADGWYPTLEYDNGGRVIGNFWCPTQGEAESEARAMIACMEEHPGAFRTGHPEPNQLIDLTLK